MKVTYYEVRIIETSAALFSSNYCRFNNLTLTFDTLEKANAAIIERYPKERKRSKMYQGESEHIGYVYRFRNADMSHSPVEQWNQQDWVSIHKIVSMAVV